MENPIDETASEKFVPRGATAFFILLMLLGAAIWFGIYFIMLGRS
jgi:hypothetical protein